MSFRVYLPALFLCTTALLFSQETPGRLSVSPTQTSSQTAQTLPATSNSQPATQTSPATSNSQPATNPPKLQPSPSEAKSEGGPPPAQTPPAESSNVTDAPLPEIANQPKVIAPGQTQAAEGPKGPRNGRWYIAGAGGAVVQQIVENGSVTAIGQVPLQQEDSGQLGAYAAVKVGYDFAVRDVQLAFGGPTPMRTAMELELNYFGSYEEQYVYPQGGANVGTESFNLTAYSAILNGLIKFEDLPITPYFGGGIGASVLYATNHKLTVNGNVNGTATEYTTATANANNVVLALQAIVGIERQIYQNLSMFIEYRFLAYMDVQFAFGNEQTPLGAEGVGGSNSSNDFLANQIVSAGLKWSF
jgi:opacity protein-like surface antigen